MIGRLRTQTYFRLSFLSAENNSLASQTLFSVERNDSRKYVCVRRLHDWCLPSFASLDIISSKAYELAKKVIHQHLPSLNLAVIQHQHHSTRPAGFEVDDILLFKSKLLCKFTNFGSIINKNYL